MALNLITDRTQADVDRYYYFRNKKWADLTTDEKSEWLAGLKGCYNYTDFQRVENAVKYLSDLLNAEGYTNRVVISDASTYTHEYIRDREEIIQYLDNIATLQEVYYNNVEIGMLPTIDSWLSYEGANIIERILLDIEQMITNMQAQWRYSGELYAGEGYFS